MSGIWLVSVVCFAHLVSAFTTFGAINGTTTFTSALSSVTANSSSGAFCCSVFIDFVALNVWYTSSLEYVEATVITEYAQYNNTVLPTATTTITNNATNPYSYGTRIDIGGPAQYSFTNVPNILGYDEVFYDGTAVDSTTVWQDNNTAISSPTPFAVVSTVFVIQGTSSGTDCIALYSSPLTTYTFSGHTFYFSGDTEPHYTETGYTSTASAYTSTTSAYSITSGSVPITGIVPLMGGGEEGNGYATMLSIAKPWYYLPGLEFNSNWTNSGTEQVFPPTPEFLSWLESQPEVLSQFPSISQCQAGFGEGAPTLHIPVAELTIQSARTIPVGGNYGTTAGSYTTPAGGHPHPTQAPQTGSATHQSIPSPTLQPSVTWSPGVHNSEPYEQPTGYTLSTQSMSPAMVENSQVRPVSQSSGAPSISYLSPELRPGQSSYKEESYIIPAAKNTEQSVHPSPSSVPQASDHTSQQEPPDDGNQVKPGSQDLPSVILSAAEHDSDVRLPSGSDQLRPSSYSIKYGYNNAGVHYSAAPGSSNQAGESIVGAIQQAATYENDGASGIPDRIDNPSPASRVLLGDAIATPVASGLYDLSGGQRLGYGGTPIVSAGTTYSLGSAGGVTVNDHTVSTLQQAGKALLSFGTVPATRLRSDAYEIAGQTLIAGDLPITVSGSTYSLSPSSAVVINEHTFSTIAPIPTDNFAYTTANPSSITAGTAVLPVQHSSASALILDGQTLIPGGVPVTVTQSGLVKTLSLPLSAFASAGKETIFVDGRAMTLSSGATAVTAPDGVVLPFTSTTMDDVIVGTKALSPGGSAMVTNGVTLSEAENGDLLEASGGVTKTLGGGSASGGGVGGYIYGGLGGSASGTPGGGGSPAESTPASFEGKGMRVHGLTDDWRQGYVLFAFAVAILLLA